MDWYELIIKPIQFLSTSAQWLLIMSHSDAVTGKYMLSEMAEKLLVVDRSVDIFKNSKDILESWNILDT